MIAPDALWRAFEDAGVRFATGVPDSLLKSFCACIEATVPAERHVIAANEGCAIGLAAGWHLGRGGVPLVYLQNSGLGNVINPLVSLADPGVYGLPMVVMIGWRGEPGVTDEPQHRRQGEITPALLDALGTPWQVLTDEIEGAKAQVAGLVATAVGRGGPVALLVRKGAFSPFLRQGTPPSRVSDGLAMDREAAIAVIVAALAEEAASDGGANVAVVATTGMASRELFELRVARGEPTADFYTVGSMGHASSIALGLALARPDRRVVLLDGDGALLMHLGAAASVAASAPANLLHIVLDNAAHDSVGGQPTTHPRLNFAAVASALGYRDVGEADDEASLRAALGGALQAIPGAIADAGQPRHPSAGGPTLLHVRIRRGARSNLGRPTATPAANKAAFMARLGPAQDS